MRDAKAGPLLHLVGFGSQAQAWAQCLRASGGEASIYLARSHGPSYDKALELGFRPERLEDLARRLAAEPAPGGVPHLVALLCPDTVIGSVYREFIAPSPAPVTAILGHGYAVYAGDLQPARPEHELALLAPKAIGPKIWQLYLEARAQDLSHRLVAGFNASAARAPQVRELAQALGFAPGNLVSATFEQEAIGDLLSEQGLLCGGVFTLMEWTMEAMRDAGVPSALIHEECLTELELIAGLLRERGPASTFKAISQAAQCGTVAMQARLEASDAREHFRAQLRDVLTREFAREFARGEWKTRAAALTARLESWQKELKP